jgi:hypothetical protein
MRKTDGKRLTRHRMSLLPTPARGVLDFDDMFGSGTANLAGTVRACAWRIANFLSILEFAMDTLTSADLTRGEQQPDESPPTADDRETAA